MSIYAQDFTNVTDSESTAILLHGSDLKGVKGVIKGAYLKQTSGAGAQWKLRYYLGWTASKTARYLTGVTLPSASGVFGDGTDEDSETADPPMPYSTMKGDLSGGWNAGAPRAGLGVYITAERLDATGNTNLTTETEMARR